MERWLRVMIGIDADEDVAVYFKTYHNFFGGGHTQISRPVALIRRQNSIRNVNVNG
jgi:hypothetical protein